MTTTFQIHVPVEKDNGQGIPVDYLYKRCVRDGIHDISMMNRLYRAKKGRKVEYIHLDDFEKYQEAGWNIISTNIWVVEAN